MSEASNIIVLKFGSSVLRSVADCPRVIGEIYRHVRTGHRVVVVVSAFEGLTDQLTNSARSIVETPDATSLATLLATGELQSAAILTLHLQQAGIPASLADHHRLGLRTEGSLLEADPRNLDIPAIEACLNQRPVLVVPGFVGVHEDGRTSLLGRGGSDLTAIFLAGQLKADRCLLIKDVDGLYDHDPNESETDDELQSPKRFSSITFGPALQLEAPLVQTEAIAKAKQDGRPFEVGCLNARETTCIGANSTRFGDPILHHRPLKIALLGCGHVGQAVVDQILHYEDEFEIVGVGVRDPFKSRSLSRNASIDFELAETVLQRNADVVVELIGGINPARTFVTRALQSGRHVITANKQLIARHGVALRDLARRSGVTLSYSPAVGGGVPMLEAVRRVAKQGRVTRVRGVLNGTCNYILERLEQGDTWDDAMVTARRGGFAEAEAAFDLEGLDTAHKLIILAREAFGVELPLTSISRRCLDESAVSLVKEARRQGKHLRQIGECAIQGVHVNASVELEALPPNDALKPDQEAGNTLELHDEDGVCQTLKGLGAGGCPTATSVLADLLEIARNRISANVATSQQTSCQEVVA
ncbi:MAG: homoserine dehydrogenase [Planctomycetota bacterium]|nr:homoserine dehydrogenase [Planctomycetota bacterium]